MSRTSLLIAFLESLAQYGVLRWIIFACVTFVSVRYARWLGMFVAHCVVAVIIAQHDIRWIEAAMKAPGWDGAPDMDGIFWVGVAIRIVLVNSLLLPVAFISYRYRSRDDTDVATQTT
jgi:hypothetical protein